MVTWMIKGHAFGSCNCDYACPCQFGAPKPTHGSCEGFNAGQLAEGHFGDTRLGGLRYALLFRWPGPIHEGNGTCLAIIDERGDAAQREAMRKILHGEETEPGATHFNVFASTMSKVLDPVYAPIEFDCDLEARRARVAVPGLLDAHGEPIRDVVNDIEHRVRIDLPNGFEYRIAEIGRGFLKTRGEIAIEVNDGYGQFNELHLTNQGVVR